MLKHTFFMGLSTVLRLLTGVVVFIILARAWGPEKFGVFMYAFTLTTLPSLVADYGFAQQLMRDVASKPEAVSSSLAGVLSAKIFLVIGLIALAGVLTVMKLGQVQDIKVMWLLLLAGLIGSFAEAYIAVFRGLGRYHEETVIMAWVNCLYLGSIFALLWMGVGVLGICCAILVSRIFFLLLTLRVYDRLVPHRDTSIGTMKEGIAYLKSGFPFAAESGFINFQSQADTLIVNYFLGPVAVGVYQAGLRLMQGANSFAPVLSNVYLPAMAGKREDNAGMRILMSRLFWQMLLIGAVCFVLFALGADFITKILYGEKFHALVELMPWFGLLLLLRYVAASHGVALSAIGLQTSRVVAIAIALATLFVATTLLIPHFGLMGMVWASSIAVSCLWLQYFANLAFRRYPVGFGLSNVLLLIIVVITTVLLLKGV